MRHISLLFLSLFACADDIVMQCDEQTAREFSIAEIQGLPEVVGAEDFTLRGFLNRPNYVTIYSLTVAGLSATDEGENFTQFSVTIPAGSQMLKTSNPQLPVTVLTNCGPFPLTPIKVSVTPPAPVATMLSIALDPAFYQHGYLPLVPIHPLEITVRADAAAKDASVGLATSLGTLLESVLVLRTEQMTTSASTYLLPPDKAGRAVLVARSGKVTTDNNEVVFLGAPRLSPSGGPIYVGTTLVVIIDAPSIDGVPSKIATCDVTAPLGVTVTGPDMAHQFSITVGVGATEGHVLQITCRDVFGQAVSGIYTVTD